MAALPEKKRLYAEARLDGKNQSEAAAAAGSKATGTALAVQGTRYENDPEIQAYIKAEQEERRKASRVDDTILMRDIEAIRDRALRGEPIIGDDGKPTGKFDPPDLRLALKAIAMLKNFWGDDPKEKNKPKSMRVIVEDWTEDSK